MYKSTGGFSFNPFGVHMIRAMSMHMNGIYRRHDKDSNALLRDGHSIQTYLSLMTLAKKIQNWDCKYSPSVELVCNSVYKLCIPSCIPIGPYLLLNSSADSHRQSCVSNLASSALL